MKLIANSLNGTYFQKILPDENIEVGGVYAAIVYEARFPNC